MSPSTMERHSASRLAKIAAIFACILSVCAGFDVFERTALAQNKTPTDGKTVEAKSPADDVAAAAKPRESKFPRTPTEIVNVIGWWFIVPFVLASFILVWFSIERLVVLRRGRVIPRPFVERFIQHLEQGKVSPDTALEICEENGSPVAQVFAHGVRKWGKPSVEVEQAIIDGGERQVSQLRKHLRILNGVATVAPLIGLLGTVIGMIQAFLEIEAAAGLPGVEAEKLQLATGIALALLTTAIGLGIAIPSLILYMYLSGRVDAVVMDMDLMAQDVVHLISGESLATRPIPARPQQQTAPAKKAV